MNWLCALGAHRFVTTSYRHIKVYRHDDSVRPTGTETEFSGHCARCKMPMTKFIDGEWEPPKEDRS